MVLNAFFPPDVGPTAVPTSGPGCQAPERRQQALLEQPEGGRHNR